MSYGDSPRKVMENFIEEKTEPAALEKKKKSFFEKLSIDILLKIVDRLDLEDVHNLRLSGVGSNCNATNECLSVVVRTRCKEIDPIIDEWLQSNFGYFNS